MPHRLLCTTLITLLAAPAALATGSTTLTIYHADNAVLFSGSARDTLDAGHALVYTTRAVDLAAGNHAVQIEGLPAATDAETVTVGFDPSAGIKVLQQQLRVAHPLADAVGQSVDLVTADGSRLHGTLLGWAVDTGAMIRTVDGRVHLVRRYAAMTLPSGSLVDRGILRMTIDAKSAGQRDVRLTYMTTGLGWRAAYSATLADGSTCQMTFRPEASIANRSGRDYDGATVKLLAGRPNLGSPGVRAYGPVLQATAKAAQPMPVQAPLGDYRSFTLPGAVNLPNGTVTLVPLYRSQTVACTRKYVIEDGSALFPPHPNLNDYGADDYHDRAIASTLAFTAPDALPAGTLRAWITDRDGAPALLGEGSVADTPRGRPVSVELGQSFELQASRERTAFRVDARGRTLTESYRITLSNGGDAARTVTVREHPNRWREWTVAAFSSKPVRQTPQLLEFRVPVGPHGNATLTYTVEYTWTSSDL